MGIFNQFFTHLLYVPFYTRVQIFIHIYMGSCDDIGQVTIRYPIGHFLLVVLWNWVSISSRFRDIWL